jgi:hypothetical protein
VKLILVICSVLFVAGLAASEPKASPGAKADERNHERCAQQGRFMEERFRGSDLILDGRKASEISALDHQRMCQAFVDQAINALASDVRKGDARTLERWALCLMAHDGNPPVARLCVRDKP